MDGERGLLEGFRLVVREEVRSIIKAEVRPIVQEELQKGVRLIVREELGSIPSDVSTLKSDVSTLKGDVKTLKIRMDETYKLAQRANVLCEDLKSQIQQVAEGVLENRQMFQQFGSHEDRIVELEWRMDMHQKLLKNAV